MVYNHFFADELHAEYIFASSNNYKTMKSNFLLILVFILTGTVVSAQETELIKKNTPSNNSSINTQDENTVNELKLIDAAELKSSISKSSSDIRIYLNIKRNAGNISFVFPKINKVIKA